MAWTLSVLYFSNWYVFFGLMSLELVVPYIAERTTDKGSNTKYHFDHIEERLGLLTIIVLGESTLASVLAFEQLSQHYSAELAMFVAGVLMILLSMWWIYFDDKVESELGSEQKAFVWSYGHYFIYGFATAVGALISVNIDVLTEHAEITQRMAVNGLAITVSGFLVSVWLCHDCLLPQKGIQKIEMLLLAVLILGIGFFYESVLSIGVAFALFNAVRLLRQHRLCKSLPAGTQ